MTVLHGVKKIDTNSAELDLTNVLRLVFNGEDYAKVSELGTPADGSVTEAKLDAGIDAQTFDATFSPFTYEPTPVDSESVDAISSHLNGIDEHFKHIKLDTFQGTSGEAIGDGDVCYMDDTDGKLYKATASTAVGNLFIADADATGADETLTFIMSGAYEGLNYETGQSFDTSKPVYVSATEAGKVTFVKPATGVVVGYALSTADEFFLKGKALSSSSVTSDNIAADAIDGSKIADDSIGAEHLIDGAVGTAALGADAVDGSKIADDSIGAEHVIDSAIGTAALADSAVTPAKLSQAMVEVYRVDYDLSSASNQTFFSSAPADLIIKSVMCVKNTLADGDGGSIQLGLSGDADAILAHVFDLSIADTELSHVGYLNASVQDLIAAIAAGTATQGTGSLLIEGVR